MKEVEFFMKFDLSNGINNTLEYQILNNHNAVDRIISAFETAWRNGNRAPASETINNIIDKLGIDPTLLSSYEIAEISRRASQVINN